LAAHATIARRTRFPPRKNLAAVALSQKNVKSVQTKPNAERNKRQQAAMECRLRDRPGCFVRPH
jgi:hypothetical protein